MRERRGKGGRRRGRAAEASKGQSLEALKGQERLKWERCSMCLESEGQEAVMGDEPGDRQGQSVKDFECHTSGLGVDELQPEAGSGPLPVIVNKVLLEDRHTHSFIPCLLFSCDGRVE